MVRWIIWNGRPNHKYDGSLNPDHGLDFLLHPIKALFARNGLPLKSVFRYLNAFARIYRDNVVKGIDGNWENWENYGSIDFSFIFDDDECPKTIAQRITAEDLDLFSNSTTHEMRSCWEIRVRTVEIYSLANQDSIKKTCEVIEWLMRFRNLFSAILLLRALKNQELGPTDSWIFWKLLSTNGDYQFYESHWSRDPALPFLVPHWELDKHDICFILKTYVNWRSANKEDDLVSYHTSSTRQDAETDVLWDLQCLKTVKNKDRFQFKALFCCECHQGRRDRSNTICACGHGRVECIGCLRGSSNAMRNDMRNVEHDITLINQ